MHKGTDKSDAAMMGAGEGRPIDMLMDVPLRVSVELGRRAMTIAEVLQLGPGAVVELSKASGEPLDIYINERLVARGEAVIVGERYGVRIAEVLATTGSRPPRDA